MYRAYPTDWPLAHDPMATRDDIHRSALREARVATDYRRGLGATTAPWRRTGLISRLRVALTGRPTPAAEPCACPA